MFINIYFKTYNKGIFMNKGKLLDKCLHDN